VAGVEFEIMTWWQWALVIVGGVVLATFWIATAAGFNWNDDERDEE